MKTNKKQLAPRNSAPVKRENVATVSTDPTSIVPLYDGSNITEGSLAWPFAVDDAE